MFKHHGFLWSCIGMSFAGLAILLRADSLTRVLNQIGAAGGQAPFAHTIVVLMGFLMLGVGFVLAFLVGLGLVSRGEEDAR